MPSGGTAGIFSGTREWGWTLVLIKGATSNTSPIGFRAPKGSNASGKETRKVRGAQFSNWGGNNCCSMWNTNRCYQNSGEVEEPGVPALYQDPRDRSEGGDWGAVLLSSGRWRVTGCLVNCAVYDIDVYSLIILK